MKLFYFPVAAAALLFAVPALAQSPSGTAQTPMKGPAGTSSANMESSQEQKAKNLLTISKLKQDLEKAGFSDIQVLSDSFVVQAKDKNGNPTVMSLSPGGVFAIAAMEANQQKQAKAGSGQQSGTR